MIKRKKESESKREKKKRNRVVRDVSDEIRKEASAKNADKPKS